VDVSQLKRVPLFADVPEESLRKIAPFTKVDEIAEGRPLMQEGGYSNDFFVIEEGTAKVERDGEHVADVGPGDVVGEEGLLEKSQRSATVTATADVRVIKIEHWELSRMKKSMPEVVERLQELVEQRQKD
jgi:CRP/FNR family cyclic AMP-dependent transcriptional regulator